MANKERNVYMTVSREETIDKSRLHAYFDRSTKDIEDYLDEYQYVSNYQTYKYLSNRIDHRHRLIDLYDYIMQDAHLSSIIDSLFQQILGERYYFVNDAGEKDEEATQTIKYSWFTKLIRGILEAKPYGYTLIELGDYDSARNTLKGIDFIERRNVAPRDNMVLERPYDTDGWDITSKDFATDYVLIDGQEGYGLLLKAAPLVIAKRYAIGAHLYNAETYGVPFIHGKSEDDTLEGKRALAEDVARAGRERIIITGTNDSVGLLQQTSSDTNKIYTTLVDLANSELSKLFIGQTGTTESTTYAGSAQVMYQVYQDRIEALREFVVNIINEEIVPRLVQKGLKVLANKRFTYSNTTSLSPETKIKMYDVLLKYFEMDAEEIDKEFGIKVGASKLHNNLPAEILKQQTGKDKPKDSVKASVKASLTGEGDSVNFLKRIVSSFDAPVLSAVPLIMEVGAKYGHHYRSHTQVIADLEDDLEEYEAYLIAYLRYLFEGNREAAVISAEMVALAAQQMLTAFEQGYGIKFSEMDLYAPENDYYRSMVDNIFSFTAAKQYQVFAAIYAIKDLYKNDFGLFREEALRINRLFNKNYAGVENSHTGYAGQMAQNWRSIEDPDTILEYVTQKDERVRDSHRVLDGIKRRKSDPFWLNFYPPIDYNCRCFVRNLGTTNGQKLNMDRTIPDVDMIPDEFRFNVGEDGIVWNKQHPYFTMAKRYVSYVQRVITEAKRRLGY
jgi:hypothetical protein